MKLHPCDCGCGKLIEQAPHHGKWYASNACRQRAWRKRHTKKMLPIESLRRCVNCGCQFTAHTRTQKFHSTSCRVSFFQQMKRIAQKQEQGLVI